MMYEFYLNKAINKNELVEEKLYPRRQLCATPRCAIQGWEDQSCQPGARAGTAGWHAAVAEAADRRAGMWALGEQVGPESQLSR